MGLKLFDDDNTGGSSDGDVDKIEIDKEFARRFEHNKKREDEQRRLELEKKGHFIDSDSDSSSEEEWEEAKDGKKKELEFIEALIKVRNQDPILKDKDAKLFPSESETDDENEGSDHAMDNGDKKKSERKKGVKKEKKKPLYLKDVTSQHLIEEGPEFGGDDDDDDENKVKSYTQEQEETRLAVLKALKEAEDGEEGELLMEKSTKGGESHYDDEEYREFNKKLDKCFEPDDQLDEGDLFLKNYFKNRLWLGQGDYRMGIDNEGGSGLDVSEDEEEIERQEDYEREYNFRFEENAGDRVIGHSRVVEGSVRKKLNSRKLQRERKEERLAQAEIERKEELKHLKNMKKKEMMEKIRKIREAAGISEDGSWLLEEDDLEEDFDPDEYDKKMKKAFDEIYYEAEDVDPDFGSENDDGDELEKPNFDQEDELLGLAKGWDDVNGTSDGFLAAWEKILKEKTNGVDNHHELEGGDEAEVAEDGEEVKRKKKRKRKVSEVEKSVTEQFLEEFHKLEYEDTIGDLKTRFKYRDVKPKKYGLTVTDVLAMDDKELNQFVSLKKLAPYREKEWEVPRTKILQQKQKIKISKQVVSNVTKSDMHKTRTDMKKSNSPSSFASSDQEVEKNASNSSLSRSAKRRRRQALSQEEFKISHTRNLAYGNIPVKTKNKMKHSVEG